MKTILVGINSKYIHPNLAIRYLKANTSENVSLLEFTIKDDIHLMIETILNNHPDIIGFSVYIWNVEIIKNIIKLIRESNPHIIIILGGPEVSYVNKDYFDQNLCDYIISNEGEIAFDLLLKAIKNHTSLKEIPNLIYKDKEFIIKNKQQLISNLDHLKSPYNFLYDKDIEHKIQYVELSRGCPYQCSYCLASLENGLRFFSVDHVLDIIDSLTQKGAKTFKFLDRSFNANHKLAQAFLEKLYAKNYQNVVFQFEINGDVLKEDFIDFLIENTPKNLIRFELGIQSTNDLVNKEVNRYQDTPKLISNIKKLQKAQITLHLDLIAGLPYEDLTSFKKTFNDIYNLFADELQLGFLKVLRGTDIYYKTKEHGIHYHPEAPYEIIENNYISQSELSIVHDVETMLNIYWNKGFMNTSLVYLTQNKNAFEFFYALAKFFRQKGYPTLRYNLYDLFTQLIEFLKENALYNHEIDSYLKYDYLAYHPIKPKIYWQHPENKNDILRLYHKEHPEVHIDDLYKYAIVTKYLDQYLIVSYQPNHKAMLFY